uniref:Ribosome-binding factor A n=1 Tax=Rhabditophanes sp. KR3021 TaxID=114890 RepID=A0AC35UIG7_9BILA
LPKKAKGQKRQLDHIVLYLEDVYSSRVNKEMDLLE